MTRDDSGAARRGPAPADLQSPDLQPPAAVGFVGWSGSGKTTLIEGLIAALRRRGYRVGALKHDAHRFEIDLPGKDSYRLTAAGAHSTLVVAADKLALIRPHEDAPAVESLLREFFTDCDIVLVEGYKRSQLPKIEVWRPALAKTALAAEQGYLSHLIAVATDAAEDASTVPPSLPPRLPPRLPSELPRLDLNDIEAIAEFVIARIMG